MKFSCKNSECGDFEVTKEKGQGYAENKVCWTHTDYKSRNELQGVLDEMCAKCMDGKLSLRNI
jgi:hypothetical protein